jgi:hypothetical protein
MFMFGRMTANAVRCGDQDVVAITISAQSATALLA